MLDFLKENWLWILAPIVIVVGFIVFLTLMGGDNGDQPFIYNIW